jgi:hypothetical protein
MSEVMSSCQIVKVSRTLEDVEESARPPHLDLSADT